MTTRNKKNIERKWIMNLELYQVYSFPVKDWLATSLLAFLALIAIFAIVIYQIIKYRKTNKPFFTIKKIVIMGFFFCNFSYSISYHFLTVIG